MTVTNTIRLMAAEKEIASLREELKEAVEIIRFTVTSAETEAECISMVERRDAFLKKHEDTNV